MTQRRGLLLVIGLWDHEGGLQERWSRVARGLAETRQVTVLTWAPRLRPSMDVDGGVRIVRVPCLVHWDRDRSRAVELANTAVSLTTAVVAALLLARRWDVAVGAGLHPEGTVAGAAARVRRRPFFSECWLVGEFGNVARLERSSFRRLVVTHLRKGGVFANTQVAEDELRRLGIPPERVTVSSLTLDRSRFHPGPPPANERQQLLYAGRLDLRQKRLDLLLDAWDRVAPDDWELIILGSGSDHAVVEEHAARCRGQVRLLPWTNDVAPFFAGADAHALPTMAESPGNALLEGMACGLPGLASDITVFRRMGLDGVQLVENTVDAWEAGVRALISLGVNERRELGARAARWVEENTSPTAVDDLAAVLDG